MVRQVKKVNYTSLSKHKKTITCYPLPLIFAEWLMLKLGFVLGLYAYFLTLNAIYKQQIKGIFRYTSQQLRIWNEVATIFLVAIVMLVVVKDNMSFVWGLLGLFLFVILLMSAIKLYKMVRKKQ